MQDTVVAKLVATYTAAAAEEQRFRDAAARLRLEQESRLTADASVRLDRVAISRYDKSRRSELATQHPPASGLPMDGLRAAATGVMETYLVHPPPPVSYDAAGLGRHEVDPAVLRSVTPPKRLHGVGRAAGRGRAPALAVDTSAVMLRRRSAPRSHDHASVATGSVTGLARGRMDARVPFAVLSPRSHSPAAGRPPTHPQTRERRTAAPSPSPARGRASSISSQSSAGRSGTTSAEAAIPSSAHMDEAALARLVESVVQFRIAHAYDVPKGLHRTSGAMQGEKTLKASQQGRAAVLQLFEDLGQGSQHQRRPRSVSSKHTGVRSSASVDPAATEARRKEGRLFMEQQRQRRKEEEQRLAAERTAAERRREAEKHRLRVEEREAARRFATARQGYKWQPPQRWQTVADASLEDIYAMQALTSGSAAPAVRARSPNQRHRASVASAANAPSSPRGMHAPVDPPTPDKTLYDRPGPTRHDSACLAAAGVTAAVRNHVHQPQPPDQVSAQHGPASKQHAMSSLLAQAARARMTQAPPPPADIRGAASPDGAGSDLGLGRSSQTLEPPADVKDGTMSEPHGIPPEAGGQATATCSGHHSVDSDSYMADFVDEDGASTSRMHDAGAASDCIPVVAQELPSSRQRPAQPDCARHPDVDVIPDIAGEHASVLSASSGAAQADPHAMPDATNAPSDCATVGGGAALAIMQADVGGSDALDAPAISHGHPQGDDHVTFGDRDDSVDSPKPRPSQSAVNVDEHPQVAIMGNAATSPVHDLRVRSSHDAAPASLWGQPAGVDLDFQRMDALQSRVQTLRAQLAALDGDGDSSATNDSHRSDDRDVREPTASDAVPAEAELHDYNARAADTSDGLPVSYPVPAVPALATDRSADCESAQTMHTNERGPDSRSMLVSALRNVLREEPALGGTRQRRVFARRTEANEPSSAKDALRESIVSRLARNMKLAGRSVEPPMKTVQSPFADSYSVLDAAARRLTVGAAVRDRDEQRPGSDTGESAAHATSQPELARVDAAGHARTPESPGSGLPSLKVTTANTDASAKVGSDGTRELPEATLGIHDALPHGSLSSGSLAETKTTEIFHITPMVASIAHTHTVASSAAPSVVPLDASSRTSSIAEPDHAAAERLGMPSASAVQPTTAGPSAVPRRSPDELYHDFLRSLHAIDAADEQLAQLSTLQLAQTEAVATRDMMAAQRSYQQQVEAAAIAAQITAMADDAAREVELRSHAVQAEMQRILEAHVTAQQEAAAALAAELAAARQVVSSTQTDEQTTAVAIQTDVGISDTGFPQRTGPATTSSSVSVQTTPRRPSLVAPTTEVDRVAPVMVPKDEQTVPRAILTPWGLLLPSAAGTLPVDAITAGAALPPALFPAHSEVEAAAAAAPKPTQTEHTLSASIGQRPVRPHEEGTAGWAADDGTYVEDFEQSSRYFDASIGATGGGVRDSTAISPIRAPARTTHATQYNSPEVASPSSPAGSAILDEHLSPRVPTRTITDGDSIREESFAALLHRERSSRRTTSVSHVSLPEEYSLPGYDVGASASRAEHAASIREDIEAASVASDYDVGAAASRAGHAASIREDIEAASVASDYGAAPREEAASVTEVPEEVAVSLAHSVSTQNYSEDFDSTAQSVSSEVVELEHGTRGRAFTTNGTVAAATATRHAVNEPPSAVQQHPEPSTLSLSSSNSSVLQLGASTMDSSVLEEPVHALTDAMDIAVVGTSRAKGILRHFVAELRARQKKEFELLTVKERALKHKAASDVRDLDQRRAKIEARLAAIVGTAVATNAMSPPAPTVKRLQRTLQEVAESRQRIVMRYKELLARFQRERAGIQARYYHELLEFKHDLGRLRRSPSLSHGLSASSLTSSRNDSDSITMDVRAPDSVAASTSDSSRGSRGMAHQQLEPATQSVVPVHPVATAPMATQQSPADVATHIMSLMLTAMKQMVDDRVASIDARAHATSRAPAELEASPEAAGQRMPALYTSAASTPVVASPAREAATVRAPPGRAGGVPAPLREASPARAHLEADAESRDYSDDFTATPDASALGLASAAAQHEDRRRPAADAGTDVSQQSLVEEIVEDLSEHSVHSSVARFHVPEPSSARSGQDARPVIEHDALGPAPAPEQHQPDDYDNYTESFLSLSARSGRTAEIAEEIEAADVSGESAYSGLLQPMPSLPDVGQWQPDVESPAAAAPEAALLASYRTVSGSMPTNLSAITTLHFSGPAHDLFLREAVRVGPLDDRSCDFVRELAVHDTASETRDAPEIVMDTVTSGVLQELAEEAISLAAPVRDRPDLADVGARVADEAMATIGGFPVEVVASKLLEDLVHDVLMDYAHHSQNRGTHNMPVMTEPVKPTMLLGQTGDQAAVPSSPPRTPTLSVVASKTASPPRSPVSPYARDDVFLTSNVSRSPGSPVAASSASAGLADDSDDSLNLYDFADVAPAKLISKPAAPATASASGSASTVRTVAKSAAVEPRRSLPPPEPPSDAKLWEGAALEYLDELLTVIPPETLLSLPPSDRSLSRLPLDIDVYLQLEHARQADGRMPQNMQAAEAMQIRHKLVFDAVNEELMHLAAAHRHAIQHWHRLRASKQLDGPSSGSRAFDNLTKDLVHRTRAALRARLTAAAQLSNLSAHPMEGPAATARAEMIARGDMRTGEDAAQWEDLAEEEELVYALVAEELVSDLLGGLAADTIGIMAARGAAPLQT